MTSSESSHDAIDDNADDLQFGEVQHAAPRGAATAPTDDGHLTTSEVLRTENVSFAPTEVYVDVDVMLEMQEHAAEDTSVELGGILLGRRGQHPDGTPFVVISDSLRARYYKATRGSFTFTHETWADLDQQRSVLPETTEIVGWYHTHPGWGVFLSDMDIFICDHFFSHPDDVALVIDPTSGDTGLFLRRDAAEQRAPRRLDRYWLFGHRRRQSLLDQWSVYFSGVAPMSHPAAVFPGRNAPPVIVASGGEQSGMQRYLLVILASVLGSQVLLMTVLVGLLFWQPQQRGDQLAEVQSIQAREAVIDDLLERMAKSGPEGVDASYRELALRNMELQSSNLGLLTRVQGLDRDLSTLRTDESRRANQLTELKTELAEVKVALQKSQAASVAKAWWHFDWVSLGVGAGAMALLAAAIGGGFFLRSKNALV